MIPGRPRVHARLIFMPPVLIGVETVCLGQQPAAAANNGELHPKIWHGKLVLASVYADRHMHITWHLRHIIKLHLARDMNGCTEQFHFTGSSNPIRGTDAH